MRITRRDALQAMAGALLSATWLTRSVAARDDAPLLDWPHLIFQAPPVAPRERSPVFTAVSLHPQEPLLAAAGDDHMVYLWDYDRQELRRTLRGHADWVQAAVFSPNGHWLASAGNDRHVFFWNVATGEVAYVYTDPKHVVTDLAWSHDGTRIAGSGFEDRLRVYDTENRQLRLDLHCPCRDMRVVAWSPDDRWLASAGRDGVTRVWSAAQGEHQFDYRAHRQRVRGLAFSPDGQYIATSGEDRTVHVHGVEADDEGFDLPRFNTKVLSIAFYGPHHLATGGADNRIRLWDLREQREVGRLTGPKGSVAALASRDQRLVAGCYDATARLWTLADQVASEPGDAERASVRTSRLP